MAILVMIFRKMKENKWLEFSLLAGLVISIALVSSVPIYTNAILQRALLKDLQQTQLEEGRYPAVMQTFLTFQNNVDKENRKLELARIDQFVEENWNNRIELPVIESVRERQTRTFIWKPADPTKLDDSVSRRASLRALSDLEDHIRLVDGRLPATTTVDGVYEVLVTDRALTHLKVMVGHELQLEHDDYPPIVVRIVGVIDRKQYDDLYWFQPLYQYGSSFLIPFELFEQDFTIGGKIDVQSMAWHTAYDYSSIRLDDVEPIMTVHDLTMERFQFRQFINIRHVSPMATTMENYLEREEKLKIMLWSLYVPLFIMLAYYLYMVANLIVNRQKTEIAVLRSRGASRIQILFSYAVEGLILGAIALLIGPPLGMLLTKVLGASSGFLQFVHRAALSVTLDATVYQYAVSAVIVSLVMTLIPAWFATGSTIVERKREQAREQKPVLWHRIYLDVVLLLISLYGLRSFHVRMRDLLEHGIDSASFSIDPLLFVIPATFIFGFGLLLLRLYPLIIRFIYWLGKKWWPPALYSTMVQVGRSSNQYQFLMMFLTMTVAVGLFSASAVRTINNNNEEMIRYQYGADIVLNVHWENDAPPETNEMETSDDSLSENIKIQYSEPPFQLFTELPGVEEVAKVFRKEDAIAIHKSQREKITLMGIDSDSFGRTSWFRHGLLDVHFYHYLNLLAQEPTAVLVSRTYAEQTGAELGDMIQLQWPGVDSSTFRIYAIVDYWPTFNPYLHTGRDEKPEMLVVGNLEVIQTRMALEPYEVWLKLEPGASVQPLYDEIAERRVKVESLIDVNQKLIQRLNDPMQLALNGVMTLGFLIAVFISFAGFLIFWIISLQNRIQHFGIFRAIGLSFWQLVLMIVAEQVLTSVAALGIGAITGNVVSRLYVPLFQLSYDPTTQVPPFRVIFDLSDQMKLYGIIAAMIGLGLILLSWLLKQMKVHQAVKLGED